MRTSINKTIQSPKNFKQKLLRWAKQFRETVYLDSNDYPEQYATYDCILAVDAFTAIQTDFHHSFENLKQYQQTTKDWLFGYLSYDLKNDVEQLDSNNLDPLGFSDLFFFQPKKIFFIKEDQVQIKYLHLCDDEIEEDWESIQNQETDYKSENNSLKIEQRISKEKYIQKVNTILGHIQHGDIYEANFCMEFFAEKANIAPMDTFLKLNAISLPPFSVYFKNNKHFLLSASPERYLKKEGEKIISQPIKGTAKRFEDQQKDQESKEALENNPKERAENIMITDLVRNDLSHTAQKGSVIVERLCEIHTFKQVHQMITTISSKLDPQYSPVDVIKKTFPMGSMTGAPKISSMKIIEQQEETKRGLYSGAVGYFTAEGDFDFNVVIRSILYNQEKEYVSFSVGSAITAASKPEKEYEECLLKAKAMLQVLS